MRDRYLTSRQRMVEEQLVPRGIVDEPTLSAMIQVPRHVFVDDAMASQAYGDYPLPISGEQTISQPYIVALMTQALQLSGTERVLEIGTGSGYQAAVLSRLCEKVYTVERVNQLLASARRAFDQLRYYNIVSKFADGTTGWSEFAPYDAIIVTAAGPEVPPPLIEQLAEGGRMIIPVGDRDRQQLHVLTKEKGDVSVKLLDHVRFVDLVGEYGWSSQRV